MRGTKEAEGWRDNSGGSSGASCDPGEVLSLLHVLNWEVGTTIPVLPCSQGPGGVMRTMVKMKLKVTKALSVPTCAGH